VLRSAALSDSRVIDMVNSEFVPVWINVRTTPLPHLQAVRAALVNARIDERDFIADLFSRGFFVRSVVLSPDGRTLLNPAAGSIASAMAPLMLEGKLGYAEVNAGDYLVMLRQALERYRDGKRAVAAAP
jgi:hypothetical protein